VFLAHQKSRGFLSVPVGGDPLSRAKLYPLDASQQGGTLLFNNADTPELKKETFVPDLRQRKLFITQRLWN